MLNYLKILLAIFILIFVFILVYANQLENIKLTPYLLVKNDSQIQTESTLEIVINTNEENTQFTENQELSENSDESVISDETEDSELRFTCPTFDDINRVPKSCETITPKYRKRFNSNFVPIYSVGSPGPSEATNGFRQVFMAAALLHKGILLTNFTKHKSDALSIEGKIPFGVRVDTETLCQYLQLTSSDHHLEQEKIVKSVLDSNPKLYKKYAFQPKNLTKEQLKQTRIYLDEIISCSGDFDKVIDGKKEIHYGRVNSSINNYLNKKMINIEPAITFKKIIDQDLKLIPTYGFKHYPKNIKSDLKFWFKSNDLYFDNEPYNLPEYKNVSKLIGVSNVYNWLFGEFYSIVDSGGAYRYKNPIRGASQPPKFTHDQLADLHGMNQQLIKDAYSATIHPKFITTLAKIFIKEYFGENYVQKYVAVHFRFNPGDFFGGDFLQVSTEEVVARRGLTTDISQHLQLSLKNGTYFIEKLAKKVQNLTATEATTENEISQEPGIIYIASPINIAENFHNQTKIIQNYKILTTIDIQNFLQTYRKDCWVVDIYFGDVLSTLEKEMMVLSKIFFRSRPSNWSFNEQGHRMAMYPYEEIQNDRVMFDVFDARRRRR